MALRGSPGRTKPGVTGSPHCVDQRGFHAPKPALKHLPQHLPGCRGTAKRNPQLAFPHNLALEAFCSNSSSQGFTSASGSRLLLHPCLFPSSTSSFLDLQPGFYLFYSGRDHHYITATAVGIQSSKGWRCQTGEGRWGQGPVRWLIRGQIKASCPYEGYFSPFHAGKHTGAVD